MRTVLSPSAISAGSARVSEGNNCPDGKSTSANEFGTLLRDSEGKCYPPMGFFLVQYLVKQKFCYFIV